MKAYALGVHTEVLMFDVVKILPRSGDREDARAFVFLLWLGQV
jgi:hypothetical protein